MKLKYSYHTILVILTGLKILQVNTEDSCILEHSCFLISYENGGSSEESTFLRCSGKNNDIEKGSKNITMKESLSLTCGLKPDCKMIHDNTKSRLCDSSNIKELFYLQNEDELTVMYPTCDENNSWSSWLECEQDIQFRYKLCGTGALQMFEMRLCLRPAATTASTLVTTANPMPLIEYCPQEDVGEVIYKGRYQFPRTERNKHVVFKCEYSAIITNGAINRSCLIDSYGNAIWEVVDFSGCSAKSQVSNDIVDLTLLPVTPDSVIRVSSSLKDVLLAAESINSAADVQNIVDVIDECVELAKGNIQVSHNLFSSVESVMDINETVIDQSDSGSNLLSNLNNLADGLVNSTQPVAFASENLAFEKKSLKSHDHLTIKSYTNNGVEEVSIQTSQLDSSVNNNEAVMSIPSSLWSSKNISTPQIYSFSFKNDNLFVSKKNNGTGRIYDVGSKILSATVPNAKIDNLEEPIKITFTIPRSNYMKCSFWNDSSDNKVDHDWSTEGCTQRNIIHHGSKSTITCECNHLTNFAILISPDSTRYESIVLDIISTVGCIVSITALSITVFVYIWFWELHKSTPQRILINLCISLLLLLITFILGIKTRKPISLCHKISAIIHYLTLTTFSWMAVECISLYKSVVRVFRHIGSGKKFFWISFALSWGIPAVIAGVTGYFSEDQFDQSTNYCIVKGQLFLLTTLSPVVVILFMNLILFVPIIRAIQQHLSNKEKFQNDDIDIKRRARVTISTTVLLGLTWMLGIFAIGDFKIVFQWLFAILNSFQGLFIFIFHVILKHEVQQSVRRTLRYRYKKETISWTTSRTVISSPTIRMKMI